MIRRRRGKRINRLVAALAGLHAGSQPSAGIDFVDWERAGGDAAVAHYLFLRCGGRSSAARDSAEQALMRLRVVLAAPPAPGFLAATAKTQHGTYAFAVGSVMLAVRAWIADEITSPPTSGLAMSLLTGATRLLPAADRARYTEEFASELFDVAGRYAQIRHALRVVAGTWRLRRALRATDEEPEW